MEIPKGGMDNLMDRRAFASRVYPKDVIEKLGIRHVKGILLYGPPGCGKTLIARKIGEALKARPPKIINGPEILNKYVGGSEEKIREQFAEAEEEYTSFLTLFLMHALTILKVPSTLTLKAVSGNM